MEIFYFVRVWGHFRSRLKIAILKLVTSWKWSFSRSRCFLLKLSFSFIFIPHESLFLALQLEGNFIHFSEKVFFYKKIKDIPFRHAGKTTKTHLFQSWFSQKCNHLETWDYLVIKVRTLYHCPAVKHFWGNDLLETEINLNIVQIDMSLKTQLKICIFFLAQKLT